MTIGSALSIGLGLLSLALALYFRRIKKLGYKRYDIALLGGEAAVFPEELQLRFCGEIVERVASTDIAIWNAGNVTLERNDIVRADPLRVEVSNGKILRAGILQRSREVNQVEVTVLDKGSAATVEFEYLDARDGVILKVLHTGTRDGLKLLGTLRGIPSGLKSYGAIKGPRRKDPRERADPPYVIWAIAAAGVLGAIMGLISMDPTVYKALGFKASWWEIFLVGLMFLVPNVAILVLDARRERVRLRGKKSFRFEPGKI